MWRVVQTLPAKQRAAVVLRYYEDLSEADTAQVLGLLGRQREEPDLARDRRRCARRSPPTRGCSGVSSERRLRPRTPRVTSAPRRRRPARRPGRGRRCGRPAASRAGAGSPPASASLAVVALVVPVGASRRRRGRRDHTASKPVDDSIADAARRRRDRRPGAGCRTRGPVHRRADVHDDGGTTCPCQQRSARSIDAIAARRAEPSPGSLDPRDGRDQRREHRASPRACTARRRDDRHPRRTSSTARGRLGRPGRRRANVERHLVVADTDGGQPVSRLPVDKRRGPAGDGRLRRTRCVFNGRGRQGTVASSAS